MSIYFFPLLSKGTALKLSGVLQQCCKMPVKYSVCETARLPASLIVPAPVVCVNPSITVCFVQVSSPTLHLLHSMRDPRRAQAWVIAPSLISYMRCRPWLAAQHQLSHLLSLCPTQDMEEIRFFPVILRP